MSSPQSAVRSPQSRRLVAAAALATFAADAAMAQGQGNPPPQARYSTHDFTLPVMGGGTEPMPGGNFREWMADVKSVQPSAATEDIAGVPGPAPCTTTTTTTFVATPAMWFSY